MTITATIPPAKAATRRAKAAPRVRLTIDDRTRKLSEAALACRGYNHNWVRQPNAPHRILELLREGLAESVRLCDCGCEWTQIYDATSFEILANRRRYPKDGYLIDPGTGRLPKREARKAAWALQNGDLVRLG